VSDWRNALGGLALLLGFSAIVAIKVGIVPAIMVTLAIVTGYLNDFHLVRPLFAAKYNKPNGKALAIWGAIALANAAVVYAGYGIALILATVSILIIDIGITIHAKMRNGRVDED
jgi:hypothetical protein